jgi:2,3-dihydroxybenzoate decarboxylase
MRGKVNFEEAFELRTLAESSRTQASKFIAPADLDRYMDHIKDPTGARLQEATYHGIGYTIYLHTVPGVQGMSDKSEAEEHASRVNDWIASKIGSHRERVGAFAALSMHDPAQAAGELERCVKSYGFYGALVNNFQHAGEDGETYLFYGQPVYDTFWQKCVDLDVPLYLHPSAPAGRYFEQMYAQRKYLVGPLLSFANDVSLHILGLITNGVFDRFPALKVIVGHLGEHIPFDFWRINHWLQDVERPLAEKNGDDMCTRDIYHYFKRNIWVTTSGHFSTEAVAFVKGYLGAERIMFSVDTPYERIPAGCGWFDGEEESLIEALDGKDGYMMVGRENAKRLFRLGKFPDCDA